MRTLFGQLLATAVALTAGVGEAAPTKQVVVVCSPGSPGSTDEAQPAMDSFAAAVSARGVAIAAVYDPSDEGGARRLQHAGVAIVSLPFFLAHEKALGLHARLAIVQEGRPALERWTLVARHGRIKSAGALAGFTIVSNAAFAPAFVRGAVSSQLGTLPEHVAVSQASAVLSSLRHAADGEAVAVLLDGTQEAALATLPFARELEVVAQSPPFPAGLVVTVDARISARAWGALEAALLALGSDRDGATALSAMRLARFAAIDDQALAAARNAYAGTP